jgi:hypothetical protein
MNNRFSGTLTLINRFFKLLYINRICMAIPQCDDGIKIHPAIFDNEEVAFWTKILFRFKLSSKK